MVRHSWKPGEAPGVGRSNARTLHAVAYSHFIAALLQTRSGVSRPQLVAVSGMREALISRLVNALRMRGVDEDRPGYNRVLHIAGWHPDARGYLTLAAYKLAPGQDQPKPVKPREEVVRDYLARRKAREAKAAAKAARKETR